MASSMGTGDLMMDGELAGLPGFSAASRRCTASAWRSAGARLAPSLPGPAAPVEEKEDPLDQRRMGLYIERD